MQFLKLQLNFHFVFLIPSLAYNPIVLNNEWASKVSICKFVHAATSKHETKVCEERMENLITSNGTTYLRGSLPTSTCIKIHPYGCREYLLGVFSHKGDDSEGLGVKVSRGFKKRKKYCN